MRIILSMVSVRRSAFAYENLKRTAKSSYDNLFKSTLNFAWPTK